MRATLTRVPLRLALGFLLCTAGSQSNGAGWAQDWPVGFPEAQGWNSNKLESLWAGLKTRETTALLIVRNDQIVFERYAAGFSRTKPHYTASLAKALVGGMCLMLAMDEGRVVPEDPATRFVPAWAHDARKARITVRELATHTSGIEDAEDGQTPHEKLSGWKGEFWKQLAPPRDPFTLARDVAPVVDEPGTRERYSNPGMAMLSYCLTAALRGSPHADLRALLRSRLMEPLGVPANEWSVGYGVSPKTDELSLVASWGGGAYSPNAMARVGRVLLRGGNWDGRQLIGRTVVEQATRWSGLPGHSGLGWWVNRNADGTAFCSSLPLDAFYGAGAGHQFLLVVPSLSLIVVRNGGSLDPQASFDEALRNRLITPMMDCLRKGGVPRQVR